MDGCTYLRTCVRMYVSTCMHVFIYIRTDSQVQTLTSTCTVSCTTVLAPPPSLPLAALELHLHGSKNLVKRRN